MKNYIWLIMFWPLLFIGVALLLIANYWLTYETDIFLFSDDYLSSVALTDALDRWDGGKCPRAVYEERVESLHLLNQNEAVIFRLTPIENKAKLCPPATVTISRRTAEFWVEFDR